MLPQLLLLPLLLPPQLLLPPLLPPQLLLPQLPLLQLLRPQLLLPAHMPLLGLVNCDRRSGLCYPPPVLARLRGDSLCRGRVHQQQAQSQHGGHVQRKEGHRWRGVPGMEGVRGLEGGVLRGAKSGGGIGTKGGVGRGVERAVERGAGATEMKLAGGAMTGSAGIEGQLQMGQQVQVQAQEQVQVQVQGGVGSQRVERGLIGAPLGLLAVTPRRPPRLVSSLHGSTIMRIRGGEAGEASTAWLHSSPSLVCRLLVM